MKSTLKTEEFRSQEKRQQISHQNPELAES